MINGIVIDDVGEKLPNATICEKKKDNCVQSNHNGAFSITVDQLPTTLTASYIGFDIQEIEIINTDSVLIEMIFDPYNTRWVSIGTNFDFLNNTVGLHLSNGVLEEPIIHFEDFQDKLLLQLDMSTDFKERNSIGGLVGLMYPIRFLRQASIKYNQLEFEKEIEFSELMMSLQTGYFHDLIFVVEGGHQSYFNENKYGAKLGIVNRWGFFYLGIKSGYFVDYYHHNAFMHYSIPWNGLISFRGDYERFNSYDFLRLGIHYSFTR